MRRRVATIITILLAVMLMVPVSAYAADTNNYTFSGRNADAFSYTEGADGAYDSVNVWGGNITSKWVGDGRPVKMKGTYGFFYTDSYTPATDTTPETYRSVWVNEAPAEFFADRALTGATLELSAPAEIAVWYDEMPWEYEGDLEVDPIFPEADESSSVDITLSAVWTGVGPLWQESFSSKIRTDGFFAIDRTKSTRRSASAELSVVGADGTEYFNGTLSEASIYDTRSVGHIKGMWPEF